MKRLVLAAALVVLLAVPAAAQNVDVTFSGELIGSYNSADDSDLFRLYSLMDREYSNLTLHAGVSDDLAFTYRVGLDNIGSSFGPAGLGSLDSDEGVTPYVREAYASLLNVSPSISEIRVGEFTFPFGAQQWLGYHKGFIKPSATGTGVMVSGRLAPVSYNLAVTNARDSTGAPALDYSDEKPVWAKVSSKLGVVDAGLSYVTQDDISIWGLNAAFDAGTVGLTAEYIIVQDTGEDNENFGFIGTNVPVTGPLSVFAKYYLAHEKGGTANAFAFGADYALSSNAKIRVENMSVSSHNGLLLYPDGLEAQLRVSF